MFKLIDPFLISLIITVSLASVFPCYGTGVVIFNDLAIVAIAIMFFLQGARLSRNAMMEGLLHWRLHLLIFTSTFIIFPLLGLLLHFLFPSLLLPELWNGVLFLCCLSSTVQSSIAFTSIAQGNVPAAICSATASNILGIFITPLLVGIIFNHGSASAFSGNGLDIVYQLLVPFILGQLLQPWIREWALRNKKLLSLSDRGSILIVVYSAFSEAVNMGLWHKLDARQFIDIVLIDSILLFTLLIVTFYLSRLFKFPLADRISIIFCGSKKSLASGVPIANVLFPTDIVGIIVLPLMIFHQIQLFVVALLVRYFCKLRDMENQKMEYKSLAAFNKKEKMSKSKQVN